MNNIKPLWLFSGVFLVVILWMMEFGNRPRMVLAMPVHAMYAAGSSLDSETLLVDGVSQKETVRALSAVETGLSPTVAGNLSKPPGPSSSASKPQFNNPLFHDPLRAVDEAYVCFDGSCLPQDY